MGVRSKTRSMILCGLFAAVLAVMAQISVMMPTGVPWTMQVFAVCLAGVALGRKLGVVTVIVYIALGFVGAPVFHNFTGGPQVVLGPTGGFMIGFIAMAFLHGIEGKLWQRVIYMTAGVLICHICGDIQFSLVTGTGLIASFVRVTVPYLLKDALSAALAYVIGSRLKKLTDRQRVKAGNA